MDGDLRVRIYPVNCNYRITIYYSESGIVVKPQPLRKRMLLDIHSDVCIIKLVITGLQEADMELSTLAMFPRNEQIDKNSPPYYISSKEIIKVISRTAIGNRQ
jgi:hypothetical protein